MRNQFEPAAEKPAHVRLTESRLRLQRPIAQVEHFAGIDLPRHQPFLRQMRRS